ECFCGTQAELGSYGESSGCSFTCPGDASETCGGPDANQAYLITAPTAPPPAGSFSFRGCFADIVTARDLSGPVGVFTTINSPSTCFSFCSLHGFDAFATQFGVECFCGTQAEVGSYGSSGGCTFTCPGDGNETCGGPDANQVYDIL
ncbi:unnamed protein product, partial [Chrysoparadoxa australica]